MPILPTSAEMSASSEVLTRGVERHASMQAAHNFVVQSDNSSFDTLAPELFGRSQDRALRFWSPGQAVHAYFTSSKALFLWTCQARQVMSLSLHLSLSLSQPLSSSFSLSLSLWSPVSFQGCCFVTQENMQTYEKCVDYIQTHFMLLREEVLVMHRLRNPDYV